MPKYIRLSEQVRQALARCGKSRYRISQQSGIPAPTLSRFARGLAGLSLPTLDALAACLGLEVRVAKSGRPKPRKRPKR